MSDSIVLDKNLTALPRKVYIILLVLFFTMTGLQMPFFYAQFPSNKKLLDTSFAAKATTSTTSLKDTGSSHTTPKKITGRIMQNLPHYGSLSDGNKTYYRCSVNDRLRLGKRSWGGPTGKRYPLPVGLNDSGVLDFSVRLRTSLKILVVGNSLSGQNSDALEEAFCYPHNVNFSLPPFFDLNANTTMLNNTNNNNNNNNNWAASSSCRSISLLREDTRAARKENPTHVVRLPDGGLLAHWGSFKMLKRGQDGWSPESVSRELLRNGSSLLLHDSSMDVMVFHMPSGHIQIEDVTEAALAEIVAVASELFECSAVIFVNFAWYSSGALDDERKILLEQRNEVVRTFARDYAKTENSTTSVRDVEFLDFATYSKFLIEANGAGLGIPPNKTYSLRLAESRFKHVVAFACGEISLPVGKFCRPNMFSADRMHWCPETVHGRLTAGQACILGCIYNNRRDNDGDFQEMLEQRQKVRQCSERCNAQFMSLDPIRFNEESYVDL